jgi:hypothetical protein
MHIETDTSGIGILVFGISVQDYSSTRPGRFQHRNFRHLGIRLTGSWSVSGIAVFEINCMKEVKIFKKA